MARWDTSPTYTECRGVSQSPDYGYREKQMWLKGPQQYLGMRSAPGGWNHRSTAIGTQGAIMRAIWRREELMPYKQDIPSTILHPRHEQQTRHAGINLPTSCTSKAVSDLWTEDPLYLSTSTQIKRNIVTQHKGNAPSYDSYAMVTWYKGSCDLCKPWGKEQYM